MRLIVRRNHHETQTSKVVGLFSNCYTQTGQYFEIRSRNLQRLWLCPFNPSDVELLLKTAWMTQWTQVCTGCSSLTAKVMAEEAKCILKLSISDEMDARIGRFVSYLHWQYWYNEHEWNQSESHHGTAEQILNFLGQLQLLLLLWVYLVVCLSALAKKV